jgi:hypothetical protein
MRTTRFRMPNGLNDIDVQLPELTTELPDGSTGVYQRRQGDCLQAAIATVEQIDYEAAFDWEADPTGGRAAELREWDALAKWASDRGRRLAFHDDLPEDIDYIAVGAGWKDGFRHVAVVMGGWVFEPGSGFELPAWMKLQPLKEIEFAISFEGSAGK